MLGLPRFGGHPPKGEIVHHAEEKESRPPSTGQKRGPGKSLALILRFSLSPPWQRWVQGTLRCVVAVWPKT
jgi:hypothetical protein